MRLRALLASTASLAVAAALALSAGAALAEDTGHGLPAIPPLTAAESAAAFAPVLPVRPAPAATRSAAIAPAIEANAPVSESQVVPETPAPAAAPPVPAPSVPAPSVSAPAAAVPAAPAPASAPAAPPAPVVPQTASTPAPVVAAPAATIESVLADKLAVPAVRGDAVQAGLAAFYALRSYKPAWVSDGSLTPAGRASLERMAKAADDGLDPRAYAVPAAASLAGEATSPEAAADVELAIARAIIAYSHDAADGRVDTRKIGKDIVADHHAPTPQQALAAVAIAPDAAAALDAWNPTHPGYLALKRQLAELRASADAVARSEPPRIPGGPVLKVGMSDARVAALRTRLGLTMTDADPADLYDESLAEAVRSFQLQKRLKATGTVTPQTIAALNRGLGRNRANLENEIVANMERWRWLPRDLGADNVLVNVPEFRLRVTIDGQMVHEARVVVGKPNTPTPIFSDTMQFLVMNPSWNVPQSIIRKEYLPKLANDPGYLERHGFVVTYRNGQMSVRQPPGEANALGHIKFMFPNNFSVYLHDTSSRGLFASDRRAFSHGCVRVDDPYKLAEIVMGPDSGWPEKRFRKLVGAREQRINLKRGVAVHIAYFTTFVDESGQLQRFDDLYGYDQRVMAALGLPG